MSRGKQQAHEIIEAGWQSTKLRLLALPFMVGGGVGLAYTPWLLTSLTDVDGNLEPFGARLAIAALVGGTSLLCTVGFWIYVAIYAARVVRRGDTVDLYTQGVLQRRKQTLAITSFLGSKEHDGEMYIPTRFSIRTPFITLKISGWFLPLIVDAQSRHFDERALNRLLQNARRVRRSAGSM